MLFFLSFIHKVRDKKSSFICCVIYKKLLKNISGLYEQNLMLVLRVSSVDVPCVSDVIFRFNVFSIDNILPLLAASLKRV